MWPLTEAELQKDTEASCEVVGDSSFPFSEEHFKIGEILFQRLHAGYAHWVYIELWLSSWIIAWLLKSQATTCGLGWWKCLFTWTARYAIYFSSSLLLILISKRK